MRRDGDASECDVELIEVHIQWCVEASGDTDHTSVTGQNVADVLSRTTVVACIADDLGGLAQQRRVNRLAQNFNAGVGVADIGVADR